MKTKLLCLLLPVMTAATISTAAPASYRDQLGIQMWSLRETAKEDPLRALDLVKEYGLTEIETASAAYGKLSVDDYAKQVSSRGLVAVGMHTGYDGLEKDLAGTIQAAKTLGATYIICPWLGKGKDGFTADYAHKVARDFNAWGKTVREAGLKLGIHPHGFEFVPTGAANGETLFDVIARETDPENVVFEMDVFWVVHAGQDPVTLLKRYPGRWPLMHVKDIRKGAPTGLLTGGAPATDNVAVGKGQIDWPAVLRTAQEVGVKHYLIEDETTSPLQCIPMSLVYLRELKL